jgi:prefoldin subunit 5
MRLFPGVVSLLSRKSFESLGTLSLYLRRDLRRDSDSRCGAYGEIVQNRSSRFVQLALSITFLIGSAAFADDTQDIVSKDGAKQADGKLAQVPPAGVNVALSGNVETRDAGFWALLNPLHGTTKRLHALQAPIGNLSPTIHQLREPLQQLRDPIENLRGPIEQLQEPIGDLRAPIEGLQNPLGQLNKSVNDLNEPLNGLKTPINELQKPVSNLVRSTESLNQPLSNVAQQIGTIKQPLGTLAQPLSALKRPLSEIASPLQELQSPISHLKQPLAELSPPIASLSREVGTLHEEIHGLGSALSEAIRQICMAIVLGAAMIGIAIWTKKPAILAESPKTLILTKTRNNNPPPMKTAASETSKPQGFPEEVEKLEKSWENSP